MAKQKNPWAKINEAPPKYKVGDIVYSYLTLGDEYVNVSVCKVPKENIVFLAKHRVIGYKIEKSEFSKEDEWLPLYIVVTLEIYRDYMNIEKLGRQHSVDRWWIEQGDDAYAKIFGKYPRRGEFVFR